jgi:uncharacterized protein (TIGR02118 family)
MVKLTAIYKKPENIDEFDRYYRDVHTPLAKKMPGLKKFEVDSVVGAPGGESQFHLIANLYFDDMESLKAAMVSEEGKAAAKDVNNFARGLVEVLICQVN